MYFGFNCRWCKLPTLGGDPQKSVAAREAANRRDWRELNRLGYVWWDEYAGRWCKFGPYFWNYDPTQEPGFKDVNYAPPKNLYYSRPEEEFTLT